MTKSTLVQQYEERNSDRAVEHEGRLAAAPLFRLPAREPLAADHHEAAEPEREAQAQPGEGHALGGVERVRPGTVHPQQECRTSQAQRRGEVFGGDDQRHEQDLAELDDIHSGGPATTRPFTITVRANGPLATRSAASSALAISKSARAPGRMP